MKKAPFLFLGLTGSAAIAAGGAILVLALDSGPRDNRVLPSAVDKGPATAPISPATAEAHAAARRTIAAHIARVPEYQRFFDRLRLALPSEYETVLDSFADRLVATGKEQSVDIY